MANFARTTVMGTVLVALVMMTGVARADIIYFKSGAVREVKEVLYERGGTLYYTTVEGENLVGIPVSVVARWERSIVETPPSEEKAPKAKTQSKAAAPKPALAPKENVEENAEGKAEEKGKASRRVYKIEDLPPMELALLANPLDAGLRRSLARAFGQFAVEADVLGRERERAAHMARARGLAPDDGAVALIAEVHALMESDSHDEAERSLRMARDNVSPDYTLLLLDGALAYERGDLQGAVEAWEAASRMNPSFRELAASVSQLRTEIAVQESFEADASRHFVFEFDQAVDAETMREIAGMLEEAYEKITNALNHYPRRPIPVLVYARVDFEAVTGVPADYVDGLFDGKIRLPLKALLRHRDRLRATLAHETAHAIIHAKTRGNAGRWIHEGLAQRFEEFRDAGRYAASYLRAFEGPASGGGMPLPSDYPSAHLWVEYLAEAYGFHHIVEFLDALAANPDEDAAYERAFGFSKEDLAARWPEFLRGMASSRSPFDDANPFTR